jgi:hypothetical protein
MFRKHSLRIAALMCCAVSTTAAAMDRGQFKNVPPEIREWFENMKRTVPLLNPPRGRTARCDARHITCGCVLVSVFRPEGTW